MSRGKLTIKTVDDSAGIVVKVSGEIDLHSSPDLRATLLSTLDGNPTKLFIDLTNVDYMDSSGVGTIVEAKRNADKRGGSVVLVGLAPRVRSVFEITQLDKFFTIAENLDQARAV